MKALEDACLQIMADLKRIEIEITMLGNDLASFEKHASNYPIQQLELRIWAILLEIKVKVTELLYEHDGKGSVCIMTVDDMIGVAWFEKEPAVDDSSELRTKRTAVLTAEQFFTFIEHLLQELKAGNWESAVKWLNTKALRIIKVK
jgi:hypothetical protein